MAANDSMREKIASVIATFLFTVIVRGAVWAMIPHLDSTIGVPLIGTSIIIGIAALLWGFAPHHLRDWRAKMWPLIFMGCGLVIYAGGAVAYYIQHRPDRPIAPQMPEIAVDDYFKPVLALAPQLGKPIAPAAPTRYGYQAAYERAWVIWVGREFYVLPTDRDRKWFDQPDPEWSADPRFYDDEKGRALFHTPKDKFPPYGGVANHWLIDPAKWSWIGWRKWHCSIDPDQIRSQQFENGIVFGIYRSSPLADDGQMFAVFNDGTWRPLEASVSAPKCQPLKTDFRGPPT